MEVKELKRLSSRAVRVNARVVSHVPPSAQTLLSRLPLSQSIKANATDSCRPALSATG